MRASLPFNEEARLHVLRQYEILDTADEMAYDDLVQLAATICDAPMACISLIDEYRQWFKARVGIGFRESDRDLSFCAHAILRPDHMMVVSNTAMDPRFADNDYVFAKPQIKFYAGVPLVNPEGLPLGALCVMDKQSRTLTSIQIEALHSLARQVMAQFELRRALIMLRDQTDIVMKARDEASSAEKAKSTFLSNISHEFRTPINGVMGLTSLLMSTPLTDRQKHYVETIEKSADGLLNVLSNILDFAQNDVGQTELNVARVDVFGTVDELAAMMRPMAIAKQLRFGVSVDDRLSQRLMGDALRINQMLANLVGNALKFTVQGCVEINVSQVTENQQAAVVRFEVKDTGIGIPHEKLTAIFEGFSQVDDGSDRRFGGSGLGLTICQQLAKLMGTQVNVKSELGVGSTFWFDLIMPFEHAYRQPVPVEPTSPNRQLFLGKILVVEDNEVNTLVLSSMLEKNNCHVTCVERGEEAVQAMRKEKFDLVFMDVQMPDMDGIQATRSIRRLSFPACTTPIIALTASVLREDEMLCKSAGMNDFISKPISERIITQALCRWLVRTESKALI